MSTENEKCIFCGSAVIDSIYEPDAVVCQNEDCVLCAVAMGQSEIRIVAAAEQRGYERAVAERAWALECADEMRISIIKFLGGEDATLGILFNQKKHRQNRISLASIAMAYEVAHESIKPATA